MTNDELLKTARAMALEIRGCPHIDDAAVVLAGMLAGFAKSEVDLHKRRVREVLGIPESVPCAGDE